MEGSEKPTVDYIAINKKSWNEKTDIHFNSDFYNVAEFLQGGTSLKDIELELLGNLKGKSVLHLQCHFGQDTISLARMGAVVTGVDLSDKAIERASELVQKTQASAKFICCDLYKLPQHLSEQFDIVFTSYGTIGWLPNIEEWAGIVSRYLKPGGFFIFAEFHPVVWMFDDDFSEVKYNYFNDGPIIEEESGTYAEKDADITQRYVMWNHSMSSVVNALMNHDLRITELNEYDYSPYDCFRNMEESEPGKFRIKHLGNRIPMVYALKAVNPPPPFL